MISPPAPTRPRARLRPALVLAAALLVVAGLVIAGCGLPLDKEPRPLAAGGAGTSTSVPSTVVLGGEGSDVKLFFVADKRLVKVTKKNDEVGPGDVLQALLKGPDKQDQIEGSSTAIPLNTQLLSSRLNGDVLSVDLSTEMNQIEGANQKMAYAQLVFTATSTPKVKQVKFSVDGKPVQVPTDNGNIAVAGQDDYTSIQPE